MIPEDFKFVAADGSANDNLAWAVAIDGAIAGVGSRNDNVNGIGSGSAYLFDASVGTPLAKLVPSDGAAGDNFGYAIAIGGGVVAVGAPFDTTPRGQGAGSVYLFDASTAAQLAKIIPADGATGDQFGCAVAISGGQLVVGARQDSHAVARSGSAYVFDIATRSQVSKLLASDAAVDDLFGGSVAVSNGVAVVGAALDDDKGQDSGSAYLFNTTTGVQLVKILASDGAAQDRFGISVSIGGGYVAAGAASTLANSLAGAAYTFDAVSGSQLAKVTASDSTPNGNFGRSIATDAGVVAVGAIGALQSGVPSGAAYLYDAASGAQLAKLFQTDGAGGDQGGFAVDLDAETIVVGAIWDDDAGSDSGSAYIFTYRCPADLTDDALVDTRDLGAFVNLWIARDPIADWNADGTINTLDIIAYLNSWVAGCP
ncbi:MAG: GC-type dockerin domain-anchored protein [Phycisphaerales bacterium JB041]